ncbi:L-valine transporter subunit YgaH [Acinetobacter sp.]|uniref:L-valine transporter subunit YgaH n=1 Tax=Acinetobacter sp. TaxID=472 RepID=UPI0031D04EA7
MNLSIVLIGIIVGIANFCSRFAPLWYVQTRHKLGQKRGAIWLKITLGSIGIAAISSMLIVATLPPLIQSPDKTFAMIVGFITLIILYFWLKRMVFATLVAALVYGVVYTYLPHVF